MLPKEAIEEFKEIYEKVFHEKINNGEAVRRANRLLDFYKAIFEDSPTQPKIYETNNASRNKDN